MVCFENITLNIPKTVRYGAFAEKSDSSLGSCLQPSSPEICSADFCPGLLQPPEPAQGRLSGQG